MSECDSDPRYPGGSDGTTVKAPSFLLLSGRRPPARGHRSHLTRSSAAATKGYSMKQCATKSGLVVLTVSLLVAFLVGCGNKEAENLAAANRELAARVEKLERERLERERADRERVQREAQSKAAPAAIQSPPAEIPQEKSGETIPATVPAKPPAREPEGVLILGDGSFRQLSKVQSEFFLNKIPAHNGITSLLKQRQFAAVIVPTGLQLDAESIRTIAEFVKSGGFAVIFHDPHAAKENATLGQALSINIVIDKEMLRTRETQFVFPEGSLPWSGVRVGVVANYSSSDPCTRLHTSLASYVVSSEGYMQQSFLNGRTISAVLQVGKGRVLLLPAAWRMQYCHDVLISESSTGFFMYDFNIEKHDNLEATRRVIGWLKESMAGDSAMPRDSGTATPVVTRSGLNPVPAQQSSSPSPVPSAERPRSDVEKGIDDATKAVNQMVAPFTVKPGR